MNDKKRFFETCGPFHLVRDGNKVDRSALTDFWTLREAESSSSENASSALPGAVGVYILVVRDPKTRRQVPWYVGETSHQSFKKRFTQHDLTFRKVLEQAGEGELSIFLLALKAPGGQRLRKPTKTRISLNAWLETLLIGTCLKLNPHLVNSIKTKNHASVVVPGYLNSPSKLSPSASALAALLLHEKA